MLVVSRAMDDSLGGGGVQTEFLKKYRNLFDRDNSRNYTIEGIRGGGAGCDFEGVGTGCGVRSLESIPFPGEKKRKLTKAKQKVGGKRKKNKKATQANKPKSKLKGGKKPKKTVKKKSKQKGNFKEQLLKLVLQM